MYFCIIAPKDIGKKIKVTTDKKEIINTGNADIKISAPLFKNANKKILDERTTKIPNPRLDILSWLAFTENHIEVLSHKLKAIKDKKVLKIKTASPINIKLKLDKISIVRILYTNI